MVRIEAITKPITIKIDRSPKVHEQADAVDAAWQELCAKNPRYFNGKMLAYDSYDASTGVIHASVEEYKYHAVRDTVDIGISLLAVTAMILAVDRDQMAAVNLIGKRSPQLHRYGGLWELGPSGGLDVPSVGNTLYAHDIFAEAAREVQEEIDFTIADAINRSIALVHDDAVGSTDIVIEFIVDPVPELQSNWEYTQTRWTKPKELREWIQSNPEEFIPTTAAITQYLHQTRD